MDFNYEVSRALAACEGALLVVDATQGIEAQTLANLYLALDADLTILPVINKIDLTSAQPDVVAEGSIRACSACRQIRSFAFLRKRAPMLTQVLEEIVEKVPFPRGHNEDPLQALIFDSHYDSYKGVIAYIRVVQGVIHSTDILRLMITGTEIKPVEIGIFGPDMRPINILEAGDVGYIATGLKTVRECRVGDTITQASAPADSHLPGYHHPKPMVFAGIYPVEGEDYGNLREALEKLQLNDASLVYQPETSQALNFGFRCGFPGFIPYGDHPGTAGAGI